MSPRGHHEGPQRRLLTLPNLLSVARVPLGGVFWFALADSPEHPELPFGVLAVAAATDVLDGWFARRQSGGHPSGVGSWLDPICDKFFVSAVLVALYVQRRVPLSVLTLIVTRELLQIPMMLVYRASTTLRRWLRYDFRASAIGKSATVVQFLAVSALVSHQAFAWRNHALAWWLALAAFALGVVALADYVRRAIVIGKRHQQHAQYQQGGSRS